MPPTANNIAVVAHDERNELTHAVEDGGRGVQVYLGPDCKRERG